MKLSELKPESRLFALFIGRSGSGKSGAAAGWPEPEDWDFDGRIEGLLPMKDIIGHDVNFTRFLRPKGWNDIDAALEKLNVKIFTRQPDCPKTIIIDSLGGMTRLVLSEALEHQRGMVMTKQGPVSQTGEKATGLRLEGPGDFKYESSAVKQVFDVLRGLPINVIVNAHIIERWGRPDDAKDTEIVPQEVIGEELNVTRNLKETVLTYFNEVYRFEKKEINTTTGESRHYVKFNSDMARSSLLGNLRGQFDITGKNFYQFWQEKVKEITGSIPNVSKP